MIVYGSTATPATSGGGPGAVIGVSPPYDVNVRAPFCDWIAPPQFVPVAQYSTVAVSPRCTQPLIVKTTLAPVIVTFDTRRARVELPSNTLKADVEGTDVLSSVSLNVSVAVS